MLAEHERFSTLLVPTIVPPTPPAAWITALQEPAEPEWVHLAPPVSRAPLAAPADAGQRRDASTQPTRRRRAPPANSRRSGTAPQSYV